MRVLLLAVLALAGCDRVFGLERSPDAAPPPSRWATVASGDLHTCGIRLDHTLWCWGRNDHGQLGARLTLADREADEPRQIGSDATWTQVSLGLATTCALRDDRSLWCWGDNERGQVGVGVLDPDVTEPTQVVGSWSSVSVSDGHTCAITNDGGLACWGANRRGQLGDQSHLDRAAPVTVMTGTSWAAIATGGETSCGLQLDHTAWCWGDDGHGQLGIAGNGSDHDMPVSLGPAMWQSISVGSGFACAITMDSRLRCWGHNQLGQVGDGSGADRGAPVPVDQDQVVDWTAVRAGGDHACALHGGGALACWGSNEHGELVSDPATSFRTVPTPVDGTWVDLITGQHDTCAIDGERKLSCAGYGPAGALGDGVGSHRTPSAMLGSWDTIRAGLGVTCGLTGTRLACWGEGDLGAVGDGMSVDRQAPVTVGTYTAVAVSAHVCAIAGDQRVWCWGPNSHGQLGVGDAGDRAMPTVAGTFLFGAVTSSSTHSCALDGGQGLFCWGDNVFGELNRPPNSPPLIPSPASQTGQWVGAAVAATATCAIDPGGHPACWGNGGEGQIGSGAFSAPSQTATAVIVPGDPPFAAIASGQFHTCGLTVANAAWCWGGNQFGQIGDQTTVNRATPKLVAGAWIALSTGDLHTCGVQADHSLWCWGLNTYGQLGDDTYFDRHVPTRVGAEADWADVSAGGQHTCARKQSGDVLCWGGNLSGELGDGTAWRASFVEVTK